VKLGVPVSAREEELGTRLAWVTGLRLGFLVVLLAATSFFYLNRELARYPTSEHVVVVTLGSGLLLALFYALVLRTGKRVQELAYAQILLDQLTWTAIVYVSGGAGSGAASLYGLTCLVGAVLIGLRGSVLAAVSGIFVYALLCLALGTKVLLPPADQLRAAYATTLDAVAYPLVMNSLGIGLVGALSGYLAERLKRTGGQLELASARAEQAERLAVLGRIAAGLAHEIRNPLGSISGSVEMLRESPALGDEDKQLCAIIHRESLRLNDLVTDMVDLTKPREPKKETVDLARIAREVRALASHSERSAAGDVTVRYEGPEVAAYAECDAAQMKQVLWNLVRNGVQVTRAGSSVTIRVVPKREETLVEVEDGGPGIPEKDRQRIFDAFYTTRASGAGIGLAVVKRIMDDHAALGARIEVRCPEGGGAVFSVHLRAPRRAS
jgi:two-component system, NtrC family, sensor histidine kinase HydH